MPTGQEATIENNNRSFCVYIKVENLKENLIILLAKVKTWSIRQMQSSSRESYVNPTMPIMSKGIRSGGGHQCEIRQLAKAVTSPPTSDRPIPNEFSGLCEFDYSDPNASVVTFESNFDMCVVKPAGEALT
jgi:hypothetical protein